MFRNIKDVKVGTVVGGTPKCNLGPTPFYPTGARIGVVIFVSDKGSWCIIETPWYRMPLYLHDIYTLDELLSTGSINFGQIEELIKYCKERGIKYEGN